MRTAVYPGSFDPITYGHLDIITRASAHFDHLVVLILVNFRKKTLFTGEERLELTQKAVADYDNVSVDVYNGLLVDYLKDKGYTTIVKGLRNYEDFEYESQMAFTNTLLNDKAETFFLNAGERYRYLSSTALKEVAIFGGDLTRFTIPTVCEAIHTKLRKDSET